ncbi:hypothetical protein GCK32_020638, partial [Trichostrongylus colubriformis]
LQFEVGAQSSSYEHFVVLCSVRCSKMASQLENLR